MQLKWRPGLKLRQQLLLSYLPLLIIPILVIGVVTRNAAERGLIVLVTQQGNRQATQLAIRFSNYYNLHETWDGVGDLFKEPLDNLLIQPPGNQNSDQNGNPPADQNGNTTGTNGSGLPPAPRIPRFGQGNNGANLPLFQQPDAEQVILTNPDGVIIAANKADMVGRTLPPDSVLRGVPIYYRNEEVGVVVVSAALGLLDQAQKQLLSSVNLALVIAGAISVGVTAVIGLWMSGQISAPIAALMHGVRGLAGGQWSTLTPIPVYAENELGELTRAFNQMADDLVRQQALRKQLMADIAHDLRTPLSVMTLEIEGIKEGFQTPEEAAQSLQEEVEWLSRLVNDVHTLSLLDAGQLTVQPEPTQLTVFLESIYKHWCNMTDQQQRQFRLIAAEDLPVVMIDPSRMRQVLGNLLNNAIQHTPSDATITLRAKQHDQRVEIQVIDTGQGIPAEALPHLFERFYRVDRSRNRKSIGGSGLGLSIAHQLTALQGGMLSVASESGKGTMFTIQLPVAAAPMIGS
ncbi:MAG TPA: ATP-binding protein [Phototrophicaceae bacterium]|jgi:signal transduction histidine kinase|nr:ATP-binding protein [Phototrophicaceae bacterium]